MSGAKAGCDRAPDRQIGPSTLRDRLRNVRKRKQSYGGLAVQRLAKQPPVGGRRKKRGD